MLPTKWRTASLGEVVRFVSGGTPSRDNPAYWNGNIPWFSAKDLKGFQLLDSEEHITEAGSCNGTRVVEPGTPLILVRGMTLLKSFPVGMTTRRSAFNQDLRALIPIDGLDREFVAYWLLANESKVMALVDQAGHGTGRLATDRLADLDICFPVDLGEQRTIARVLSAWDCGIRQLSDLIAAKLRFKQGLMQQLLTGKRRFKGFSDEWRHRTFGTFLKESRIPGSNGAEAKKLTVRLYGKGVCPKSDTRPGSEATQFYRRSAGQFIYSKLDFLNGAFGIVPPSLDGYESSLDLPAFDIDQIVDARWLLYFVTRPGFYRNQLGLAHGGRKARRVNPKELLKLSVAMPGKIEQTRIADALETLDKEIDLLRSERDALKKQKKGLMQKLLTGEIRVKPAEV